MYATVVFTFSLLVTLAAAADTYSHEHECLDALDVRIERIVERRLAFLREFPPETAPGAFPSREQIRAIAERDREFAELVKARQNFDASLDRERAKLDGYSRLATDLARAAAAVDPNGVEVGWARWWPHRALVWRVAQFKLTYLLALPKALMGAGAARRRTDAILRDLAETFQQLAEVQKMSITKTELVGEQHYPPTEAVVDRIRQELLFRRD